MMVLSLAGCGTSVAQHSARYASELHAIDGRVATGTGEVLQTVTPHTPRVNATRAVNRYEAVLIAAEGDLRTLRPPAMVARLHRRALGIIVAYGKRLRAELGALRTDRPAVLASAAQSFSLATGALASRVHTTVAAILRRLPPGS